MAPSGEIAGSGRALQRSAGDLQRELDGGTSVSGDSRVLQPTQPPPRWPPSQSPRAARASKGQDERPTTGFPSIRAAGLNVFEHQPRVADVAQPPLRILLSARAISARSAAGVVAGRASSPASSLMIAASVSLIVSPPKGRLPVSISKSTTPNAQMSARRSTAPPARLLGRHVGRRAHDDRRQRSRRRVKRRASHRRYRSRRRRRRSPSPGQNPAP